MNLLRTYLKLILLKNRISYFYIILSIIISYVSIAVIMIYIDNVLILSSDSSSPDLHYLYVSLRTVLILGAVFFVFSQYYKIMKSNLRDYCIMKTLGATKRNIRFLVALQMLFLFFITIPVGLLSSYLLTGLVLNSLGNFSLNNNTVEMIDSVNTIIILAGIACCFIISIGLYLERGIRKMPLSIILADSLETVRKWDRDGDII